MNPIDFLEKRLGRFAIPGLGRMILLLNGIVFILNRMAPGFYAQLDLDRDAIFRGEYWRLVTYIFIPDGGSHPIFVLFALLFFLMIVDGLEQAWGAFRFNLFYLLGVVGTTAAALIFGKSFSNAILNLSLFLAFARFYPDNVIYFFFILPIRIKWMAWLLAALQMVTFVLGDMAVRMAILVSFANFILFFGPEWIADLRHRRSVNDRRRRWEAEKAAAGTEAAEEENEPLHRCAVCRRSDQSHPELEFRVARDGNDYCLEHLPKPPVAPASSS
jgi:hypothetical protein